MNASAAPGYLRQLDALRALAVALVIVSHWLPRSALAQALPLGMIGVTIFFVLSGFLITRLLLAERPREALHGPAGWRGLGRFYARRTLRIFPAYYFTLFALFVSGVPAFRDDLAWYVLYASNVLMFQAQAWIGPAPHLWTLAVEEQFYLLWPLGALFLPRRALAPTLALAVVVGPLARAAAFLAGDGSAASADFAEVLMPGCMDSFALGGLLAWWQQRAQPVPAWGRWAWPGVLVLNLASAWWLRESYGLAAVLLFRLNVSVLALALIAQASTGMRGLAGRVLEHPLPVFVGRISYGLYLYHLFVPALWRWLGLPAFAAPGLAFAGWSALLLAIASASWFGLERPFLRLKRLFPARAVLPATDLPLPAAPSARSAGFPDSTTEPRTTP